MSTAEDMTTAYAHCMSAIGDLVDVHDDGIPLGKLEKVPGPGKTEGKAEIRTTSLKGSRISLLICQATKRYDLVLDVALNNKYVVFDIIKGDKNNIDELLFDPVRYGEQKARNWGQNKDRSIANAEKKKTSKDAGEHGDEDGDEEEAPPQDGSLNAYLGTGDCTSMGLNNAGNAVEGTTTVAPLNAAHLYRLLWVPHQPRRGRDIHGSARRIRLSLRHTQRGRSRRGCQCDSFRASLRGTGT